jgi:YebC/PmpR family DNA-binding regulatory protein
MSGHNKWSTIKHKKAAADAKKGKVFSAISKEIMVAVRQGGADPAANITLRALIQKGRSVNMPMDNIERAIKKASGDLDGAALEELSYEGYAAGGVAVVVLCLSDNKNRTAADVKHAFNKYEASLASVGSVSRMFNRKGQITVDAQGIDEDQLMELVLEAGAEDMTLEDGTFEIITDPNSFMDVVDALDKAEIKTDVSEITLLPETPMAVTQRSQASSLLRFIETLEDLEDVQNVYTNAEISDDLMAQLSED